MKTSFTSAALFPLVSLALLSSCDRSVSTVSSGNGSVAVVPRFAAASVPAASRLEARLSATGQSDSVVNVAYQKGGDLELGSVPSGASFTVSMTGYDSASASISRIYRWAGSGSGKADDGSATKYVDISTVSGSSIPTGTVSSTTVPATLTLASGAYYTTDGSDPRVSGTVSSGTVSVPAACTVKAARDTVIAGDTLWSDTVSWTFTASVASVTIVAAPTFSVAGSTYASAQKVALSSTTSGASIYYTTNGAAPTSSSTLYTDSLTVSASETIRAVAVLNGVSSEVTSATYTITPVTPTKQQLKLTVGSLSGGTVSLSPTGPTFDSGTIVTATATADSGYTFSGWTGACTGMTNTCTVTMTKDTTLSAIFTKTASTDTTLSNLKVSVGILSPAFTSSVTSYRDTVGSTATSETIHATAMVTGASVSGDTGAISLSSLNAGDSVKKTITVTNGAKSLAYTVVIVKRALPQYTLTASAVNGAIALSPTGPRFDSGTSVTATATANSGYTFSGWKGACTGTTSPCTVTMTKDTTLNASFAASSTPITVTGDSGTFTDSRDGHVYKYVKIGTQTWMAQNLNYQVDSSWCYGGVAGNCSTYGRLYQWAAAMDLASTYNSATWGGTLPHQGVCPSGWHVPSDAEWQTLEVRVGMIAATAATTGWRGTTEGTRLKANSSLWSTNTGTDAYGFSVLPAGYRYGGGSFGSLGNNADFWSSSEYVASSAWLRYFYYDYAYVYRNYSNNKSFGFSLRCLKD